MTYSVKEIYYTLQGEGARTGRPAVFLRFAGCNLWSGLEKDRATAHPVRQASPKRSQEELEELNFFQVVHPASRERSKADFRKVLEGQSLPNMDTDLVASDGRVVRCSGSADLWSEQGKPAAVAATWLSLERRGRRLALVGPLTVAVGIAAAGTMQLTITRVHIRNVLHGIHLVENNRNVMMQLLHSFEGVRIIEPGGTFYSFPDFSNYSKDSVALSKFILDKVQVLTVPGVEFGMEGYLRLSFCGTIKEITEGIERIKWALDPNSPNELYIGERKLVRDWT